MDAIVKKFDDTLKQFIQTVQAELDSKDASLRDYERVFQQIEAVLPDYSTFVSRVFEGLKETPMPTGEGAAPIVIEKEVEVLRVVEKIVEVPVDRVVEVEKIVEKFVEKFVDREVPVERIVEKLVEVEKIVERVVEKIVEKIVYVNADESAEELTGDSSQVQARAPRERSSARAPRTANSKAKHKTIKNVLVVDDAEINRVLMGHYFKALPIKIEFSSSGEDAIQKCQGRKFDLILMDLQMKDMGGIQAAEQIRSFEKETPIFAITNTEPNSDEEQQAMSAGCTRYFSKGISKETLQDQVSETLFGELLLGA